MDWDKEPTLREFANKFQDYLNDIGCMDNEAGWIGSHHIIGGIRIETEDSDDDTAYEICGLEYDMLMGCGCPSDIVIKIRKVK